MSDSKMTTDEWGNKYWKNEKGQLHQTNGAAVVGEDGYRVWYVNGKRHRLNGPAIETPDGVTSWWVNGKCLGYNNEGFWNLWDTLTPEQKQDTTLLSHLPGGFNV